jgi:hypothetical protein
MAGILTLNVALALRPLSPPGLGHILTKTPAIINALLLLPLLNRQQSLGRRRRLFDRYRFSTTIPTTTGAATKMAIFQCALLGLMTLLICRQLKPLRQLLRRPQFLGVSPSSVLTTILIVITANDVPVRK